MILDRMQSILDTLKEKNLEVQEFILSEREWAEWQIAADARVLHYRTHFGGDKFCGVPVKFSRGPSVSGVWVKMT